MQNPPTNRYTPPSSANAYSPSVPISVYRELAAELQAAQTRLESLNAQNQELMRQNQQLREEVAKVLHSAQHLQQVLDSSNPGSGVESPRSRSGMHSEPRPFTPPPPPRSVASAPSIEFPPPPPESEPAPSSYRETLVIEQEEPRPRRTSPSEGVSDISGWMLVVAILLIVLTAFGTGFLIVRPLLNNNNR